MILFTGNVNTQMMTFCAIVNIVSARLKGKAKMIFKSLLLVLTLFASSALYLARAQDLEAQPLPTAVLTQVTEAWKGKRLGRYMDDTEGEKTAKCDPLPVTDWPNWEGFQLKRCSYIRESQKTFTKDGRVWVLTLSPSKDVLIKWAIASCIIRNHANSSLSGEALINCADTLLRSIHDVSGSQFAVAGIVWEPPFYSFRDGLTIEVNLPPKGSWGKRMTDEYQSASLNTKYQIRRTGSYARIANTCRRQYQSFEMDYLNRKEAETTDTRGEKFIGVIRGLYQDAWRRAHVSSTPETVGKYRNDLMAASLYELNCKK